MNIDAHQHYWNPARGDYGWLTPDMEPLYRVFGSEELAPLRQATGIDCTVVVQAAPTVEETRYLLDLARNDDSIAGVVGWVPLDSPEASNLIEELAREPKFKGVRPMLQDLPDDTWIEHAPREAAIQRLIDLDLAFDALIFARHVPSLIRFVERSEAQDRRRSWREAADPRWYRGGLAAVGRWHRATRRVTAKALLQIFRSRDRSKPELDGRNLKTLRYASHRTIRTGASDVGWGSDWPVLNLNGSYTAWHATAKSLTSHLEKAAQDAIFGGNAHAFYRL